LYFAPTQFWVAMGFLSPPSHGLTYRHARTCPAVTGIKCQVDPLQTGVAVVDAVDMTRDVTPFLFNVMVYLDNMIGKTSLHLQALAVSVPYA
jgi:hypothetical protein